MDPIISFSGIASGIDFQSLTEQIIQVERRPALLLQDRITLTESRLSSWGEFRNRLSSLDSALGGLSSGDPIDTFKTSIAGVASGESTPLSASADSDASAGSYEVDIQQLARAEKLGSDTFGSATDALGFSGEFRINGVTLEVAADHSLDDIADLVNEADTGPDGPGLTASVLETASGEHRLVLTADETGSAGIDLSESSAGVLRSLGFLESEVSLKHATSDGAKSDGFATGTTTLSDLLDLGNPPGGDTVDVGGLSVTVDLSTMSLQDVADAINAEATAQGSSISAEVVQETDGSGNEIYRLDVSGTTSFTDSSGILELMGVVEGGRGSVAQTVRGSTFEQSDGVTPATTSTLLTDLSQEGASAGVQVGDTLTLRGTRGDGTSFEQTFTVAGGSTLQDVVDALNDASDGFQAGTRTATADIASDGSITVVDDEGGTSRLALTIVAHNEGGGTLDPGDFSTTEVGRDRQITAGADAEVVIDGNLIVESGNTIRDVITGVDLTLTDTTDDPVTVEVTRDTAAATAAVEKFVSSYNKVMEFVSLQFSGAGAAEGTSNPPLSGNSSLRVMRGKIVDALRSTVDLALTGDLARLSDIGIEVDRQGQLELDSAALASALDANPDGVRRLLGSSGVVDSPDLSFRDFGDDTEAGTYAVEITQAATVASVTGSGFGGSYVDDGTDDLLRIVESSTGSTYEVALSDGMTLTEIVDALNTEFDTALAHEVRTANALHADAVGTVADDDTVLADLHDSGGTDLGVADGDAISYSGVRPDGSTVSGTFSITDVSSQTLGDLRSTIQSAFGSSVIVGVEGGRLSATDRTTGLSLLDLSISADNAGGGTLDFGGVETVEEGRSSAPLAATDDGGELGIAHEEYGSARSFTVSFVAGGTDGSASLGLGAGTYEGTDVEGTIGGLSATGAGRILTADADTPAEGLSVVHESTDTGSVGSVTFGVGIASAMESITSSLLGDGDDAIDAVVERLDGQVETLTDRIDDIDARLEQRRESLLRQFATLEEALARAQSQSQFLTSQLGSIQTPASPGR